jgi:hypothetical protein
VTSVGVRLSNKSKGKVEDARPPEVTMDSTAVAHPSVNFNCVGSVQDLDSVERAISHPIIGNGYLFIFILFIFIMDIYYQTLLYLLWIFCTLIFIFISPCPKYKFWHHLHYFYYRSKNIIFYIIKKTLYVIIFFLLLLISVKK